MKLFLMIIAAGIMWVASPNLPTFQEVFNTQWLAPSPGESGDSNDINKPADSIKIYREEEPNISIDKHKPPDSIDVEYTLLFNEYREAEGLAPLVFKDDLNKIALLRLEELEKDFSHDSRGDYNTHLAENIAMVSFGPLSNIDALEMWKNSFLHNANMLNKYYKYTGYAIGNGYAVQVFTEYETVNGVPQLPPGWHW